MKMKIRRRPFPHKVAKVKPYRVHRASIKASVMFFKMEGIFSGKSQVPVTHQDHYMSRYEGLIVFTSCRV